MTKRKHYNGPCINIDPELVIGTREAARILGVCEREVRYKIQRKKLPALKIGNRYYINIRATAFYLALQEVLRPRWSANRAERLRRSFVAETPAAHANVSPNPAPYPAIENIFTAGFSDFPENHLCINGEPHPYMRKIRLFNILFH